MLMISIMCLRNKSGSQCKSENSTESISSASQWLRGMSLFFVPPEHHLKAEQLFATACGSLHV